MIDRDIVAELGEALRQANARPTFDRRRSIALPCWLCETTAVPRDLVVIGTYTRPMGGQIQPGDSIRRPLCAECVTRTAP